MGFKATLDFIFDDLKEIEQIIKQKVTLTHRHGYGYAILCEREDLFNQNFTSKKELGRCIKSCISVLKYIIKNDSERKCDYCDY